MIPFADAQAMVRAQCALAPIENIAMFDALHRVLARDVTSPANLPQFDNSPQ